MIKPEWIFETSWEVCNKVGGIYTVLSSRAKVLSATMGKHLVFIGPDVWKDKENPDFTEDKRLYPAWRKTAADAGLSVRIGRWNVPGEPVAVLIDFTPFFERKNEIYGLSWQYFNVDSLHAYGDYDEASMFSYAAGHFVSLLLRARLLSEHGVIYQAHEWMSGLGMLHLKREFPAVATIFTTHATSIGRSIAGNNKLLYKYFSGYNGDQMARELHMEAKHSIEKQSAWGADCFTTVSSFTDAECRQLLDKSADVVLPNGFDKAFVPNARRFATLRKKARRRLFDVVRALTGRMPADDTVVVSTSGRNDYRCKGFDVYIDALAALNRRLKAATDYNGPRILGLIEVPCWMRGPRADVLARLKGESEAENALPMPQISHDLYNMSEDRILQTIQASGLSNGPDDMVDVLLIPCYLDGRDGIFDISYYDMLPANDACIYPSYYEPWGYTPLEAAAFGLPCITTDLSGFGQWATSTLQQATTLADGVMVLHRDDDNYGDLVEAISGTILRLATTSAEERKEAARKAKKLAAKADWVHFIKYYDEAYQFALQKTAKASRQS